MEGRAQLCHNVNRPLKGQDSRGVVRRVTPPTTEKDSARTSVTERIAQIDKRPVHGRAVSVLTLSAEAMRTTCTDRGSL